MNLNTSDQIWIALPADIREFWREAKLTACLAFQGSLTQQNYAQPNYKRLTRYKISVERNFTEKIILVYDYNVAFK